MTTSAQWIRRTYGVPAEKHRRVVFSGLADGLPRHGTIVGFADEHLLIRLDGQRRRLQIHPTWRVEYLDEMTNRRRCEQCGRVGTQRFRTIPPTEHTKPIVVCSEEQACRRRRAKPGPRSAA